MKRVIGALLFLTFFAFLANGNIAQAGDIKLSVNGKEVSFGDKSPILAEKEVLLPLREVFETMGFTVEWNNENASIQCIDSIHSINLYVGETSASKDSQIINLSSPVLLKNNCSYIAMDTLKECTGAEIKFETNDFNIVYLENISDEVKIVNSSETMPGYGLENAFDGIAGNYAEFKLGEQPCEFILELGCERRIKRIEVDWDQGAYPETYSLYDTDYYGMIYSKIRQIETNSETKQVIEFPKPIKSAFIKFSIPGNSKLDNLKLKSINIWAEPQTAIGKILMDESPTSKEAFLPSNSSLNPLRVWGQPISKSMKILADDILKEKGNLTTHQKIVEFMLYMNDFKVGNASENRPEVTIRERIGACGSFSNVLVALAATQGIPGRLISMANYPKSTGHAVVELLVNGRWQLYDPTYAAYYTTTPKDKENPYVLSFDELRAGMGKEKGISIIVGNQERLEKGKPYSLGFLGPDIYEKANPAGVFGPDKPFIYPLSLDINSKTSLTREEFNTSYQGVSYIGAAGICNMQSWTLKGLSPGRSYCFNIVPDYLGGDVDKFKKFEAKAQILSGGVINSGEDCSYSVGQTIFDPWVINFTATEPSSLCEYQCIKTHKKP